MGPQVHFFVANMLLSQIRQQWQTASASLKESVSAADRRMLARKLDSFLTFLARRVRAQVYAAIMERLRLAVAGEAEYDAQTLGRLAVALASAAALTGGTMLAQFVSEALSLAGDSASTSSVRMCLDLLDALAYETLSRPHVHRSIAIAALQENMVALLGLAESVLSGTSNDIVVACIKTLASCVPAGVNLGNLQRHKPAVLAGLLSYLGTDDERVFDATVDAVLSMVGDAGRVLSPATSAYGRAAHAESGDPATDSDPDAAAAASEGIGAVVDGLLAQRPRFDAAVASSNVELCRGLCRIAVAIGDAAMPSLAVGDERATGVIEILLDCTEHEDMSVRSLPLDVWPALGRIEATTRAPHLRVPLFRSVLERVLRACVYPGEGEAEVDPDDFTQFRERQAAECIEVCFSELGAGCTKYLEGVLEHAEDGGWSAVEVVLFAARCCRLPIRSMLREANPDEDFIAAQRDVGSFLRRLFDLIGAKDELVTSHPNVIVAAVRCVACFAALVAKQEAAINVVGYVANAMCVPEAQEFAAEAFRNMTVHCASRLNNDDALRELTVTGEVAVGANLSSTGRVAFMGGLARVVATSPPELIADRLGIILEPSVNRLSATLDETTGPLDVRMAAAQPELEVIAATLRFGGGSLDELPAGTDHPIVVVAASLHAALEAVAATMGGNRDVADALNEVCRNALLGARPHGQALLPQLCSLTLGLFQTHGVRSSLDTMAEVLEFYGEAAAADPSLGESLASSFSSIFARCYDIVSTTAGGVREVYDVLGGLFALARHFVMFAPALLLPMAEAPGLVGLAGQCIDHPDRANTAVEALRFLQSVGMHASQGVESSATAQALVAECAGVAVSLVGSIADGACMPLVVPAADALRGFVVALGGLNAELSAEALSAAAARAKPGALRDEVAATFARAALSGDAAAHDNDTFRAIVEDFAALCAGGEGRGVLASFA